MGAFADTLNDGGTDFLSGGGGLNFGSTPPALSLDSTGAFGSTLGSAPSDTSNGFWNTVQSGVGALNDLANLGLGVYKSVQTTSKQTTGQPEKTPDGRYVANIQGQPTVLTRDSSAQTMQLLLVGALIVGAVVLLRKLG